METADDNLGKLDDDSLPTQSALFHYFSINSTEQHVKKKKNHEVDWLIKFTSLFRTLRNVVDGSRRHWYKVFLGHCYSLASTFSPAAIVSFQQLYWLNIN